MKTGRNDPCPCGSGKKYKNCCLVKERAPQTAASLYLPSEMSLNDKVLSYLDQERFDWDYEEAQDLWYTSLGTHKDGETREGVLFTVWFIQDYRLSYGKTLLELFYDERRHNLDALEAEILEALLGARLGMYEVNSVKEGTGVGLTEIFTGEECFAYDVSASRSLVKWDIVLAWVFRVRGLNRLQGAALIFASTAKEALISLGEELFKQYRRSRPDASWAKFMKEEGYRFNAAHDVLEKRFEEMQLITVEGDELVYSRAVYRVKDFEKASRKLDRLKSLFRVDETEEDGGSSEVHYSWATSMEEGGPKTERRGREALVISTHLEDLDGPRLRSLGDIVITSEELSIECLSRERLEKGKRMLQRALGDSIEHLYSEYRDVRDVSEDKEDEAKGRPEEAEGYVLPPEVSRRLTLDSLDDHYRKWLGTPIPALKGVSPREASKTREGRTVLKELLKSLENIELRRWRSEGVGYPVDKLRRELDMVEPALEVISSASFYSNDSEKTKVNWLCYELAMGIYDKIMEEEDEEFMRNIFDVGVVTEFSIHLSKRIGGSLTRKPSGRIDEDYAIRSSKRFFPGLTRRVHDIMVKVVSEAVKELLEICESCPTRCLYEKNARCTMFDEGGFPDLLR